MTTIMTAGEDLIMGDMIYLKGSEVYKIINKWQIPRGVAGRNYKKGDVVDSCVDHFIDVCVRIPRTGIIGIAGEDLIGGGAIGVGSDGKWYNKSTLQKKAN